MTLKNTNLNTAELKSMKHTTLCLSRNGFKKWIFVVWELFGILNSLSASTHFNKLKMFGVQLHLKSFCGSFFFLLGIFFSRTWTFIDIEATFVVKGQNKVSIIYLWTFFSFFCLRAHCISEKTVISSIFLLIKKTLFFNQCNKGFKWVLLLNLRKL